MYFVYVDVGYRCVLFLNVGYRCILFLNVGYRCILLVNVVYQCILFVNVGYRCILLVNVGYQCILFLIFLLRKDFIHPFIQRKVVTCTLSLIVTLLMLTVFLNSFYGWHHCFKEPPPPPPMRNTGSFCAHFLIFFRISLIKVYTKNGHLS